MNITSETVRQAWVFLFSLSIHPDKMSHPPCLSQTGEGVEWMEVKEVVVE